MYNDRNANTYIRTLYSPGFSYLAMSFFKTNLTLNFVPYIGNDSQGLNQYCRKTHLSTSITLQGAAYFYLTAMSVISEEDSKKQVESVLQCRNGTTLIFEYKPDQNNQMNAYLVIKKNNSAIPFMFSTLQYAANVNSQMVTKVMHADLLVFAKILDGYLAGIGADIHLNKLGDDLERYQHEDHQAFITAGNNN
jgi:hypothetical protein